MPPRTLLIVAASFVASFAPSALAQDGAPPAKPYRFPEFMIVCYADFPGNEDHKVAMAKYALNKGFNCVETVMDNVDACRKAGMLVRVGDIQIDKLLAAAPKYRDDPAIFGYFISDRRSKSAYPGWAEIQKKFDAADPNHPALFINAANSNQYTDFIDIVKPKVLDYYHYHWYSKNHPERYYHYLKHFRDLSHKHGIPQMRVLGSNNPPEKIRQSMYVAAAYGVQGFHFWPPHFIGKAGVEDGKPVFTIADHAQAISEVALEFKVLGPTLMKCRCVDVYHTDKTSPLAAKRPPADAWVQPEGETFLVSLLEDENKGRYLMPVNHAIDKARELTMRFTENVGLERLDRQTASWTSMPLETVDGKPTLKMTLRPGDGELLRVVFPR